MQFSVLTLRTLGALEFLTEGKEGVFVPWQTAVKEIEKFGFSAKQVNGELDRFCYGFECIDRCKNNHEIALTHIGTSFLKHLLEESPYQSSQLAFLSRKARRKNYWNVTVQESTFFNPEIYQLISEFNFRSGGTRDFIKSIPVDDLIRFLKLASNNLSIVPSQPGGKFLKDVIEQVKKHGKYWASVGGRYSWFVFAQKFELPFSFKDWHLYDKLMTIMIRPPEWGGGIKLSYQELSKLLEKEKRLYLFRDLGIIRSIWTLRNLKENKFCLTAPGYLMWERKKKGFLFEFRLRKLSENEYELALCNATDFPKNFLLDMEKRSSIPSIVVSGSREKVLDIILKMKESVIE